MCKKRINLMKIIPKIVLYVAVVLLLSVSLNEKADSQIESSIIEPIVIESQAKVEPTPYSVSDENKIKNPIYKEKIILSSSLKLDH